MIFAPICGFILLKKDAVNWCKSFIHFLRNLIHILANFAVNLLSIRDMKNEKACPNRFRREGDKYYYCCNVWFGKWIIRQVENCTKNTLTLVEELLFDDHQLYGKNLARKKGEKSGSTYLHTIAGGDCPKFETFFSVQNLALISIFAVLLQKVQGLFYSWSSFKSFRNFWHEDILEKWYRRCFKSAWVWGKRRNFKKKFLKNIGLTFSYYYSWTSVGKSAIFYIKQKERHYKWGRVPFSALKKL